jgi:succinyl-diaminopimelate desuccinylase
VEQKIACFVEAHMDEMIEDIARLVAIRSIKGEPEAGAPFGAGPAEALTCAKQMAEGYGFSVRNEGGYVLEVNMNGNGDELGILCHLDVVHEGTGWSTPPYELDRREGRIYGRGAADNKGPAVAALYAMRCVRELGIPLKKNVRLMLGTDEENGSSDLKEYFKYRAVPRLCFSPDAAFPVYNIEKGRFAPTFFARFAENSDLPRVVSAEGGHAINIVPETAEACVEGMRATEIKRYADAFSAKAEVNFVIEEDVNAPGRVWIRSMGAATHASYPEYGKNALTAVITLLASMPFAESEGFAKIKATAGLLPHGDFAGEAVGIKMADQLSGPLTCNLGTFRYSLTQIEGGIDIRCPICSNEENVSQVMAAKFDQEGLSLSKTEMSKAHYIPENLPFIKTLLKAYERYTGKKGECLSMGGGTYVHGMENSVAFGPCYPETETFAHAADEYAVIDELKACVKIFAQVIIDMCA